MVLDVTNGMVVPYLYSHSVNVGSNNLTTQTLAPTLLIEQGEHVGHLDSRMWQHAWQFIINLYLGLSGTLPEFVSVVETLLIKVMPKITTETVSISQTAVGYRKPIPKIPTETKTISDSLLRRVIRPLTETKSISDSIGKLCHFFRVPVETTVVSETKLRKFIPKLASQTITISDSKIRKVIRNITQNAGISHTGLGFRTAIPNITTQTVTISDSVSQLRHFFKVITDSVTIAESLLRKVKRVISNTTTITGVVAFQKFSGFIHHSFTLTETIAIAETQLRDVIPKIVAETISISESKIRDVIRNITNTVTISDSTPVRFGRSIRQTTSIAETLLRNVKRKLATQTTTISGTVTGFRVKIYNIIETVAISESIAKLCHFFRKPIEGTCSVSFDGSKVYVDVSGTGTLINSVSVAAWVKFINDEGNFGGILSSMNGEFHNRLLLGGDNKTVQFELRLSVSGIIDVSYTMTDPGFVGQWHHFAATYDGFNMMLYIDGSPVGSAVSATGFIESGPDTLKIGWGSNSIYHLDGNVAEVSQYNIGLTEKEVSRIYNDGNQTVTNGLIHHWRFNEGSGDTIHDYVGNRDGTIINGTQWSTDSINRKSLSYYEPLYIYPNWYDPPNYKWPTLISEANLFPNMDFVVVINPNSGPDTFQNSDYVHGITDLKGAPNIKIIGYVFTSYGARSEVDVKADVDAYFSFYPNIDGIMFDEFDNITGHEAYYQDITAYTHTKFPIVFANPGTSVAESYITALPPTADVLIIYENNVVPTEEFLGNATFNRKYPEYRFAVTIRSLPTTPTVQFQTMIHKYVRYAFITDGGSSYGDLPTYLHTELTTVPTVLDRSIYVGYVIDSIIRHSILSIAVQTISITSSLLRKPIPYLLENTVISSAVNRLAKFFIVPVETTVVTETQLRKVKPKIIAQTTSISESVRRNAVRIILSAIAISESQLIKCKRYLQETVIAIDLALCKNEDLSVAWERKTVSDSMLRTTIPFLSEVITIVSNVVRHAHFYRTVSDNTVISDSINRLVLFIRNIHENISVLDSLLRTAIPSLIIQTIAITESRIRKVIPNITSQTTSISESLVKLRSVFRSLSETKTISDSIIRRVIRPLAETTSIADSRLRKIIPRISLQTTTIISSLVGIKGAFIALSEVISITDSTLRRVTRKISNSTSVSESLLKIRNVPRSITQTITITDSTLRKIIRPLSDIVTVSEITIRKAIPRIVTNTVTISNVLLRKPIPSIVSAPVSVSDTVKKMAARILTETRSISDSMVRKAIPRITTQNTTISSTVSRVALLFRKIFEIPKSVNFNGITQYASAVPYTGFTNTITIAAWVKFIDVDSGGWGSFISGINSYNENKVRLAKPNIIMFELTLNGVVTGHSRLAPSNIYGDWHFYTLTYDGSSMVTYFDGVQVGSTVAAIGNIANTDVTSLTFAHTIGQSYHMSGNIAEIALYSDAKTPTDVTNLYNTGIQSNMANIIGYYKMNEGSGSTVYDYVSRRDATLINSPVYQTDVPPTSHTGIIISDSVVRVAKRIFAMATETTTITSSILRKVIPRIATQITNILDSIHGPKGAVIALIETVAILDALAKSAKHFITLSETKSISSILLRTSIPSITSHTVNITDSVKKKITHMVTDAVNIAETQLRLVKPRISTQTTAISDSMAKMVKYLKTIAETTSIAETQLRKPVPKVSTQTTSIAETRLRRVIPKISAQSTVISDSILRKVPKSLSDTVSIVQNTIRKVIPKITTQNITVSDSLLRRVVRPLTGTVTIVESILRRVLPNVSAQTTAISSLLSRIGIHLRTLTENTSVSESHKNKISRFITQTTTIFDSVAKAVGKLITLSDTVVVSGGSISRRVGRALSQTVIITSVLSKVAKHFISITENRNITELLIGVKNKVAIVLDEEILIVESISKHIARRIATQTTVISGVVSKVRNVPRILVETITIKDKFVRLPGVLFNIAMNIETVLIRESGFAAPRGPTWRWLFTPWKQSSFTNKFDPDRERPAINQNVGPAPSPPEPFYNARQPEQRKSSFTHSFTPKFRGDGSHA